MSESQSENGGALDLNPGAFHLGKGAHNEELQEAMEEVNQHLQGIHEEQLHGRRERKKILTKTNRVWSAEDIFKSVVLAAILTGVVGLFASIVAMGYGFAPIFIVGLLFLSYAYYHGLPSSTS